MIVKYEDYQPRNNYYVPLKTTVGKLVHTTVRLLRFEGERNPNHVDVEPGGGAGLWTNRN